MTTRQPVPAGRHDAAALPPRRWPRRLVLGAAIVVLAAIGLLALSALRDDDETARSPRRGTPSSVSPTRESPTTQSPTSPTPSSALPPAAEATALWPFPGSGTGFATPEDAARSFATTFLRFPTPVVEAFRRGDSRSGEVPIRPTAGGPVTTILVRQVGSGDAWSVLGAGTANIEVTVPSAGAEVTSPVEVAGRALAFEGTVQVEVREDDELGPIGAGFVTGGGDVPRPFTGSVPFATPGAPYGALVLFTTSAENGQVWEAAAFRVAFRPSDAPAGG